MIAGTLELFVGAYLITFGILATIYFSRMQYRNAVLLAGAAVLFGVLLVFRAARLLGWRRWFFWLVLVPLLIVPVAWYIRPLLFPFR